MIEVLSCVLIMLYMLTLHFSSEEEIIMWDNSMVPDKQYLSVLLKIMLYKVVPTCETSMDEILNCDPHLNVR